jgi:hypothetical protein
MPTTVSFLRRTLGGGRQRASGPVRASQPAISRTGESRGAAQLLLYVG